MSAAPKQGPGPAHSSWPAISRLHTLIFDFDGVFTDNHVDVASDGIESVRCNRADGLGIAMLRRYAARHNGSPHWFILSTETDPVVAARARKLKTECLQGVDDKVAAVDRHFSERRAHDSNPYAGLLFAGNDLNDLALIQRAGYSVVPADAHPLVQRHATYTLPQRGGDGFVRAIVERLLDIDTLSLEGVRELVSDR